MHIGGTDFDRLLDLSTVMPYLGYKHVGTGGRIVPSSVFFDLSSWHLIHQAYTRKAMHFAKELWTDYADQTLHARLMDALEGQHGHRMLAGVEAAKIACSIFGEDALVDLDFLGHGPSEHLGATVSAASRRNSTSGLLLRAAIIPSGLSLSSTAMAYAPITSCKASCTAVSRSIWFVT